MKAEVGAPPLRHEEASRLRELARPVAQGLSRRCVVVTLLAVALAASAGSSPSVAQPASASKPQRLLAFGDSLTAGYGLAAADGFTARLEAALRAEGLAVEVINAGVSGDTTAGGLARIAWTLAERPDALLLELGANDGLRGIPPDSTYANLDGIVRAAQAAGVPLLLAGMYAPRNMGPDYVAAFDAVYPRLAAARDVPLHPFFLEGVATRPELNQPDGIHPNPAGVDILVRAILPKVKALLASAARRG